MKRLFLTIILLCTLLTSCEEVNTNIAKEGRNKNGEYFLINSCEYYKIKIGEHDAYQYTFRTYRGGTGSDIIHFEDMCEHCKKQR